MSLGTCPLFIETAVLGCSRIEYLRIIVSHLTIRSNYFEQLKLSIHVMLHFLIQSNRKITVALNSRDLLMSRMEFYEYLSDFIEIANLYVIDRKLFAAKRDWCLIFGNTHNLSIRDVYIRRRR